MVSASGGRSSSLGGGAGGPAGGGGPGWSRERGPGRGQDPATAAAAAPTGAPPRLPPGELCPAGPPPPGRGLLLGWGRPLLHPTPGFLHSPPPPHSPMGCSALGCLGSPRYSAVGTTRIPHGGAWWCDPGQTPQLLLLGALRHPPAPMGHPSTYGTPGQRVSSRGRLPRTRCCLGGQRGPWGFHP